jgi:transposase-like protein
MAVAKTFTPELIAHGRRRYEETDEPVASIAADFGVHERTMRDYVRQWNWTPRSQRPAHDLSPLARLQEEAKAMPTPCAESAATPADTSDASAVPAAPAPPESIGAAQGVTMQQRAAMIERLWQAASSELAAVERMRAHIGMTPQAPVDAERTARTLESLTRTLKEVDRLRSATAAPAADDDDDLPRDIDEFRRALARRIHAFVASRTAGAVSDRQPEAERPATDRT